MAKEVLAVDACLLIQKVQQDMSTKKHEERMNFTEQEYGLRSKKQLTMRAETTASSF